MLDLDADIDDPEGYWKVFAANYLQLLPIRLERVRLALTTAGLEGSLDAVLSLKTSSQMVGADRLAAFPADLERAMRAGTRENNPVGILPRLAAVHLLRFVTVLCSPGIRSGCCWRNSGAAQHAVLPEGVG